MPAKNSKRRANLPTRADVDARQPLASEGIADHNAADSTPHGVVAPSATSTAADVATRGPGLVEGVAIAMGVWRRKVKP